MVYKAITVTEPYASIIASGIKQYETRSWKTDYRGKILIHASKSNGRIPLEYRKNRDLMRRSAGMKMHYGEIICVADLIDCIEMTEEFISSLSEDEKAVGFYSVGRFAWKLENVRLIDPISTKGKLRIWNFETEKEI